MLRVDNPIISLDLETGGLEPGKHTVLSIGAVAIPGHGFFFDDKPYKVTEENSFYAQLEWDTITVSPTALAVHKLNITDPPGPDGDIWDRSYPACKGLQKFWLWLDKLGSEKIYAMGMNVGSFDLAMLRPIWNYGMNMRWPFHYRSIDLNSLFMALFVVQNKPFAVIKDEITQLAWARNEFPKEMEHNALADAWMNVYAWEECIRRFQGDCEVAC